MKAYIYINVEGKEIDPLPFPMLNSEKEKVLIRVKEWVKTLNGFDPYKSSLWLRVINKEGEPLYAVRTGRSYGIVARVEHAIDYAHAQKFDKISLACQTGEK